jgi:hypothetical protein
MLQSLLVDRSVVLEHRHGDGTWGRMEDKGGHHDPAAHDTEQDWQYGRVFVCPSCEEEVRIGPSEPGSPATGA